MADSQLNDSPAGANDTARPTRRAHTYSRATTAVAVLALATAVYALWRLDSARDRMDEISAAARTLEAERALLRSEIQNLEERTRQADEDLARRLALLDDVPRQVQELANTTEELRGRAEGPERAWSRAEAMYLLELAQRRLALNRDIDTAIVALASADARLAALKDDSFAPVRQEIARELHALRAIERPDITGITTRLASLEQNVTTLPVKGIVAEERKVAPQTELPDSFLPRAWSIARRSVANLIRVREVDERAGGLVTKEEALLRREHLRLLLFSARAALARHDKYAYQHALASARTLLEEAFDASQPSTQAVVNEIRTLESIDIDPPLPDLVGSSTALRRLMPREQGVLRGNQR